MIFTKECLIPGGQGRKKKVGVWNGRYCFQNYGSMENQLHLWSVETWDNQKFWFELEPIADNMLKHRQMVISLPVFRPFSTSFALTVRLILQESRLIIVDFSLDGQEVAVLGRVALALRESFDCWTSSSSSPTLKALWSPRPPSASEFVGCFSRRTTLSTRKRTSW